MLDLFSSGTPIETREWELAHPTTIQRKLKKYIGTRWAVDLDLVLNHTDLVIQT
jgi:hypothetical protein